MNNPYWFQSEEGRTGIDVADSISEVLIRFASQRPKDPLVEVKRIPWPTYTELSQEARKNKEHAEYFNLDGQEDDE